MGGASMGGRGLSRRLAIVLMVAAVIVILGIIAQPAAAISSYQSGKHAGQGLSCTSCHPGGAPNTVTNSMCTGCHAGKVAMPTTYTTCWSCHTPGQDMTIATSAACSATCHTLTPGTNASYTTNYSHGATPHLGANTVGCLNCHTVASALHHAGENAAAPTQCTDCHGNAAVPAAPAAPHGTLVAGVTACATCHKGMSPTHPLSANVKTPTLTFTATQPVGGPDVTLKGTLKNGTAALAGVTVYLQSTPDGTTFTDITSVSTSATGAFTYTVVGATPGLQYRAVAQGVAGPPVVLPAEKLVSVTVPVVKATITLKLTGLTAGKIKVNKTVTGKGTVAPSSVGEKVTLLIQKKNAKGVYVKLTTKTGLLKAGSAYSIGYKPTKKGAYRMRSSIPAKAGVHTAATSVGWKSFTVK